MTQVRGVGSHCAVAGAGEAKMLVRWGEIPVQVAAGVY